MNRIIKETKELKGLIVENCRCLKHDVEPSNTSIAIDIKKGRYLYCKECWLMSMGLLKTSIQCRWYETKKI